MTIVDEPRVADIDEPVVPITSGALAGDDATRLGTSNTPSGPSDTDAEVPDVVPIADLLRPALAAGLATSGAAMVIGGIFASWPARLLGVFAAAVGAGWALFAERSPRRTAMQAALPFALVALAALTLVTAPGGPGELPTLVGEAIDAGRNIRPPVPFDPGWRVLVIVVIGTLAFASASVGLTYGRPKLAIVVPLPLIGLASVTQPESEQFIAGVGAFLPVLAAIGVLYGGERTETGDLDRTFELRRLVRGGVAAIPIVALLVLLNSASFLFPEPVFDPDDKPQKPRAAPLSAADDRVLFEVAAGSDFTGPWRIGALDVYDDDNWLIPGYNADRLVDLGPGGLISELRAGDTQLDVTITVRDLGDSAVLPILGGTTRVDANREVVFDPRSATLRVPSGRAPAGLVYTLSLPDYANAEQLQAVDLRPGSDLDDQLAAPTPPREIQVLLDRSPTNPWLRLDFLRNELLGAVTASGAGAPIAVPPDKVVDLLFGSQKGTPFEIVAAEGLLARWAGVPSRIGFGFDGLNVEDRLETVRPRNAAQWIEVWFEGYGWVPLIGAPKQAEASLDSDPNARFNPTIEPSDDVAVEVYLPFELEDLSQLYQQLRDTLVRFGPLVALLVAAWTSWPIVVKTIRRQRRRQWAAARSPRTQVAVEYAEFRDHAIDLGVGDVFDTPLEYLAKVRDDKEHREFAWLAARALYGDLRETVSEADVAAAEALGTSLRRRLSAAQPLQLRFLAALSRASLDEPFTEEIPNMGRIRVPGGPAVRRAIEPIHRRVRPSRRPIRIMGEPR